MPNWHLRLHNNLFAEFLKVSGFVNDNKMSKMNMLLTTIPAEDLLNTKDPLSFLLVPRYLQKIPMPIFLRLLQVAQP
jgi:hypothetical protein